MRWVLSALMQICEQNSKKIVSVYLLKTLNKNLQIYRVQTSLSLGDKLVNKGTDTVHLFIELCVDTYPPISKNIMLSWSQGGNTKINTSSKHFHK